jgi:hypothetical protein
METAQHWDRLAKNQPAEITMFQISEVQESPAFNGRRSFLALRDSAVSLDKCTLGDYTARAIRSWKSVDNLRCLGP